MTTENMDNTGTLGEELPIHATTKGVIGLPLPVQVSLDRVAVLEDVMRRWVQSHLHGSPVSRDTEAFNHVTASLPALRDMIIKEA